jgi:4'-phosphopantetheinyl transferase
MHIPESTEANAVSHWCPCAEAPEIRETEAHLWLVELDLVSQRLGDLSSILSDDERHRAARFHKQVDAERFATARASLRCILGSYLRLAPDRLRFIYDGYGKPHLSDSVGSAPIHFSVSHSAALALVGVVLNRKIGVDLERVRADVEVTDLAARFFSRREAEILRALTGEEQLETFFRCWTRKEAYLKARGQGLSYGLDRVEVTLNSHEPVAILSAADDPEVSRHWTLLHLAPALGYIGAAAGEDRNLKFRFFRWSPNQRT